MVGDYYRVLGLHPGASQDEVRAAYRRQAKQLLPNAGASAVAAHEIVCAQHLFDGAILVRDGHTNARVVLLNAFH
ncbi:MAG: DnaJ domain-containing protein, partial [Acidobacteria bacterium]|nr:DnaJ domain-containing protein [Acidobacteriota bacterium]